jgi:hypothetical protein
MNPSTPDKPTLRDTGADSFPHFQTVDGKFGSDLETQLYLAVTNLEDRDFEQAIESLGAPHDHRFPTFS